MNNSINPINNIGDDSSYIGSTNNNGYNENGNVNSQNDSVVLRANQNTFNDVTGDQVNISEYVNSKGLMVGTGDSTFNPSGIVTRAQMVQTLYAMAGKPPVSGDSKFSDVSSDKWYNDAINWAQSNGIVAGYTDGTFKPDQEITREQMLAIMNKYATYCGESTNQANSAYNYSDANNISGYAVAPISWGVEHGMISDSFSNLRPKENATRMELAQMLMRYDQDYNGSTGRSAHVGAGAANMEITDVAANRAAASQASSGNVSGNTQAQRTEVVNIGRKYVDMPLQYRLGASNVSEGALDCSALTQHIYEDLGYNIGRDTRAQMNAGVEVEGAVAAYKNGDYSSLQPGDLIICYNGDHVVMYAGDGKVIHASASANKMVETSWQAPNVISIRRIIQ